MQNIRGERETFPFVLRTLHDENLIKIDTVGPFWEPINEVVLVFLQKKTICLIFQGNGQENQPLTDITCYVNREVSRHVGLSASRR